jgi:hypothetical protein
MINQTTLKLRTSVHQNTPLREWNASYYVGGKKKSGAELESSKK